MSQPVAISTIRRSCPAFIAMGLLALALTGCSDEPPDTFAVSCIDTRDCPSGQYCFCGGVCVTPTECRSDSDCCDNETCQGGLCLEQNICANDDECGRNRVCRQCYCTPPGCSTDQQCAPSEVCDGGLCLDSQEFPCLGACQDADSVCSPIRESCMPIPESCRDIACGPGETLIFAGLDDRLGPSCQQPPQCVCARSREVPPGWVGTEFSALFLGGLTFAVLAHDHRYGDLVYLEVSGSGMETDPVHLDGVPSVTPTGRIEGRRGGIYDPGPDQGGMPSAAIGQGSLAVASRDATNGDLRFALRPQGGSWEISLADQDGDTGYFPSLAYLEEGAWAVAYFARDSGLSALRLAISSTAGPDDPADWYIATVDSAASETQQGEDIPLGVGLFPSLLQIRGEIFVAYYSSLDGDLLLAREDGTGSFQVSVLDTGLTRSGIEGAGDVGVSLDMAAAPDGTLGIAYVDRISSEVWFGSLQTDGSPGEPAQFRRPPELVDPGRDAMPPALVGAGINLAFNTWGEPMVVYQDSSNGDLVLAVSTPEGWVRTPLARDDVAGFSPHLFPDIDGQTWVLHGTLNDAGEGELVEAVQLVVGSW